MKFIIQAGIVLIALLHVWFLVLEMFLWQKPIGIKTFHLTPEFAAKTASLAANQGLYNGFLAAGLIWGAWANDLRVSIFFLSCVLIAGVFGAFTVNKRIFFIQGLPALILLLAIVLLFSIG